MRLIHRAADKPIQFPRGHRRPAGEINRCGTPEGQPGIALLRRQGRLRSVPTNVMSPRWEKSVSFPSARATILQIPSSSRLIAVHRPGASRQLITRTSGQLNATNRRHCWAQRHGLPLPTVWIRMESRIMRRVRERRDRFAFILIIAATHAHVRYLCLFFAEQEWTKSSFCRVNHDRPQLKI